MEAIVEAKIKKDKAIKYKEEQERIAENRRKLVNTNWDVNQTASYMIAYRAKVFTDFNFSLDKYNQTAFDLLCHYFSADAGFISLATNIGVKNPSLEKGIFFTGNFGVGKTVMMKLFQKNKRQVYHMKNTKDIAEDYRRSSDKDPFDFDQHTDKFRNAFADMSVFEQQYAGVCFDDLGTEDIKNNFGNKINVMGDIIEMRYAKGNCGLFMHATTNLTADQLKEFYGARVISRMREVFNFIELPGNDRRK